MPMTLDAPQSNAAASHCAGATKWINEDAAGRQEIPTPPLSEAIGSNGRMSIDGLPSPIGISQQVMRSHTASLSTCVFSEGVAIQAVTAGKHPLPVAGATATDRVRRQAALARHPGCGSSPLVPTTRTT